MNQCFKNKMQDLGGNLGKNPFGENIPAKYKLIKEKQRTFNLDNGLRSDHLNDIYNHG